MDNKYPNYFVIIGILYIIFFALALAIIPADFYSLNNFAFIISMILPIPVFGMYFLEKPDIQQMKYLRYIFPILSTIAMIISFLLIWMFF